MASATAHIAKFATAERWQRFNWLLQATVCLIWLVISYAFHRGNQIYHVYVPLMDASMEMRLEATTAYLWFEEMLGGDHSKHMDEILNHLDKADWYAHAMIEGGRSQHLDLDPIKDRRFSEQLKRLQKQLRTQRRLLLSRFDGKFNVGPGSEIDQEYHETLEAFIAEATGFEMQVKSRMASQFRRFTWISLGVVTITPVLFFIIGFGFYRYENQRRKSETERLKMERMLVQNEKMAALGTMITGIAHEINNPNNFISFNIPILKDYINEILPILDAHAKSNPDGEFLNMSYSEFREDLTKILANIENGSNRVDRIVSDLKAFSKKKDQVRKDWHDLDEIVKRVLTICGSEVRRKVAAFEINVAENLPPALCDNEIVEMIIVNFLQNATDAADKSASWIRLDVTQSGKADPYLLVAVGDNGCGILADDRKKIFQPFFSTKSSSGGTGLGLYMCQSLAEQMGARIEFDSTSGEGSSFRLVLTEVKKRI